MTNTQDYNNSNAQADTGFTADDLPLSPDPDFVVPEDSLSQLAEEDWPMEVGVPAYKNHYGQMVQYIQHERHLRIQECQDGWTRIRNVEASLPFVPPEAAMALLDMLEEHKTKCQALEDSVHQQDEELATHKVSIKTNLLRWKVQDPTRLQDLIRANQWPDPQACQDLELPYDFTQLWFSGNGDNNQGKGGESPLVAELLRRIQALENERKTWKDSLGEVAKNMARTESGNMNSGNTQSKLLESSIRDRRKRARIPVFDKGTVEDAQKWLNTYESMCKNYLHFSDQEMVDELYEALQGRAGNWFNSIGTEVKKEWRLVKERFLQQFGGGAKPALAALNKLKTLKQGNMPIGEFISVFQDLIGRAQLFAPDIQLDYFKESIRPELTDAIMYGRAKDLEAAIEIVTDTEREWKRRGRYRLDEKGNVVVSAGTGINSIDIPKTYTASTSGSKSSTNYGEEPQQNQQRQQETRKCFYCNKRGHLKADCRKRNGDKGRNQQQFKKEKSGYRKFQNTQEIEHQNSDKDDINVFEHFLNNSQEIVICNETSTVARKRIRMNMDINGKITPGLIDTGSTISSMDKATATQLGINGYKCIKTTIRYGNKSTQTTTTKAKVEFLMEDNVKTTAHMYIVDQQNEGIILGVDWMIDEDIVIRPRTNSVMKNQPEETTNAMETIDDMINNEFPNLVKESDKQSLTTAPYEHVIDTGNARPIAVRDYRRSDLENKQIQQEVDKMLESGVIVPSNSDWCSPVVLIDKPDGSKRFCVDYRKLNQVTVKDKYPLPRITELLDKLNGCKYFSTIDLKSGYWQLPLEEASAKKTAFVANGSLYQFTSLPFGVVNGPSSFMRLMHMVLRGLTNNLVYLDDIISFAKTREEHYKNLRELLARLDKYNLKISIKKCQFFKEEVRFLGFLVGGNGIKSDPSKVEVVKNWPVPGNVKALQRFLGFCAFYHRFLANLSDVARPLYTLLQKENKPFTWTLSADKAFKMLQEKMVKLPTLAYPNPNLPYDLHTDASLVGLGAVLVQNGRPVAYASRTLTPAEQNYSTTERECLAIVWSLNYFYPYLYGAQFTIYTDHAALKSILSTKMPRGRIARWILTIQAYQFTIVHKKGALNSDADALSRIPEEFQNSQDLTELNREDFKNMQENDNEIIFLKKEVKLPYELNNGLLCYKVDDGRLVPVVPHILREKVIAYFHNGSLAGHFGVEKTLDKIKNTGYWKNMKTDVKEYIKCCHQCQVYKVRNDSTVPPMKPILPRYVGDIWAMDVAELPMSKNGNRYILVFMEYLTKWAITVPLPSVTTDRVVEVLLFEIALKLGIPSRLISDNGANLVADAMQMVCKRLGVKRSLTSVEHPQTDGLVERLNRTLKTSLAAYTGLEQKDSWDVHLPFVTFAYNTAKQASTGYSPFEIMYGRKAVIPVNEDLILDYKTYETEKWISYLNENLPIIHGVALENIKKAQERQKKFYDKGSVVKYDYQEGDLVLIRNLIKTGFPKARWLGPCKIIRKTNSEGTAYRIKKLYDRHQHETTANVRHMRPYHQASSSLGGDNVMDDNSDYQ